MLVFALGRLLDTLGPWFISESIHEVTGKPANCCFTRGEAEARKDLRFSFKVL